MGLRRGCLGARKRTCHGGRGVRGGRRVDTSPRPVASVDRPVPHRRRRGRLLRRRARGSPREPPSPPWSGASRIQTRCAPSVSPRPSRVETVVGSMSLLAPSPIVVVVVQRVAVRGSLHPCHGQEPSHLTLSFSTLLSIVIRVTAM